MNTPKHKKSPVNLAITSFLLGGSLIGMSSQAALPPDAVLGIADAQLSCPDVGGETGVLVGNTCEYFGGALTTPATVTGSYFSMDTNADGNVGENEKTALRQYNGVKLGQLQPASGSHTGIPNGSENPDIDAPWNFFGNTGMHQTLGNPVTMLSDDGAGNVTLGMFGWNVTWNNIASIPLGSGPDNGVGTLDCAVDCSPGDTYKLTYRATVPPGDPSGFGGVAYTLNLVGTVSAPGAIQCGSGLTNTPNCGGDGLCTTAEADALTGVADDFNVIGTYFDYSCLGIGGPTVDIILPLTPTTIPGNGDLVFRKFIGGAWTTFTPDATNAIATAASSAGLCPPPGDVAYMSGINAGDDCVQLTIEDGGPYDADQAFDGNVSDPGGLAVPDVAFQTDLSSDTSGCSMVNNSVAPSHRSEWWLIAGFIIWLGWKRHNRRQY